VNSGCGTVLHYTFYGKETFSFLMYPSHGANTCHPDPLTANLQRKALPLVRKMYSELALLLCEWLQSSTLISQPLHPITFNAAITMCSSCIILQHWLQKIYSIVVPVSESSGLHSAACSDCGILNFDTTQFFWVGTSAVGDHAASVFRVEGLDPSLTLM
jgi:hypothetical protein